MQHVFDFSSLNPCRSNLHRDAACTKGLRFETVLLQFIGDFREHGLLRWSQVDHDRHQQSLALDLLFGALPEHSLEQYAFMRHVLVNDPQAVVIHGENERLAQLAQRLQGRKRRRLVAGWSQFFR